uniref:glucuronosyltransferase n=1 Tax=Meloidogyne enterolobii TaxID=390850 RepID=A0A6V7XJY9_MELEN|nr:unnamed protein product [Meloidogyne enterolobii]
MEQEVEQVEGKDRKGKRILYICDNLSFPNLEFNKILANILTENYHKVDMLVYTGTWQETVKLGNLKIIYIPINKELWKNFQVEMYFSIGIYRELMTHQKKILDRLQKNKYDIGIAEFNVTAGAFAVFEALGIEETFNVFSSVFPPEYLQFLDINVLEYQVPAFAAAKPGEWDRDEKWDKCEADNKNEHEVSNNRVQELLTTTSQNFYNSLFDDYEISIKKPSTLDVLFKKIKYHFINQHPLIKFNNFPDHEKIVYIGGITVEYNELSIEEKNEVNDEVGKLIFKIYIRKLIKNYIY